jgi:lipoyl(octanoyl) transferase
VINVVQLGRVPYGLGLKVQEELVAARKERRISDTLLLLEHTPVITLGRNGKRHNLLASPEVLTQRGVELFECNRGGDVTFHGPGQLVGYPIFNLLELTPKVGAVDFIRRIEEALIRTAAEFGIATRRVSGLTGVWTQPGPEPPMTGDRGPILEAKLAAIGIHISRGVTSHGFALNVNTDLSYFRLIVPCGIAAKPVTSMAAELGRAVDLDGVAAAAARQFGSVFESQVLWVDTIDKLLGRTVGVPLQRPQDTLTADETFIA